MANERTGLRVRELMLIIGLLAVGMGILSPLVATSREAARRSQCTNNLKQLALSMHNYMSANNDTLPPHLIDDPLDGNLNQTQSLQARIFPYLESSRIYNQINWDVPARWGPSMPANFDYSAGGGLWGAIQHTAVTQQIKCFLCPSDPNPVNLGTLGWIGQTRKVGWNNYPNNIGLNRHINRWHMNGPGMSPATGTARSSGP